jgi:hypothetical protein
VHGKGVCLTTHQPYIAAMIASDVFQPSATTQLAYNILVECARAQSKTTCMKMNNQMASECGWPPLTPGHAWMTRLKPHLAMVGELCGQRGEPCLSALVRQQNDSIGKGFTTAYYNCYGTLITRRDDGCPCGNCKQYIQAAARDETLKSFDYWGEG